MEVLRQGKLPEEREHVGTCNYCNTQVKFKQHEGLVRYDQKDGDSVSVVCPLCKRPIYVNL